MKFRKKPVVIEAIQWLGTNYEEVCVFLGDNDLPWVESKLRISTLEGVMEASEGDWIIRGVKNEIYPCKPDIFQATYEAVE